MITIESATKSFDIMTGIFVLAMLAVIGIFMVIIKEIEKKEHRKTRIEIEKVRSQMQEEFRIEKTKTGAKKFVELYEARQTIRMMEAELKEASDELARIRSDYNRLVNLTERWSHGQK